MSQSLCKILVHVVFSTKERRPFLRDAALRQELHRYLGGIITGRGCHSLLVGGVADHVHILTALSRTSAAAEAVKEIKRSSSVWLKRRRADMDDFAWQNGYGVFSLGFSQLAAVRKYIAQQELHHQKVSFQTEYLRLLKRYEIQYDERFLWE
jgi:putative transposase